MGEDIESVAREFCTQGKVFFVHFRDIEGTGKRFHETFHDNGPTDMARLLKVYHDSVSQWPYTGLTARQPLKAKIRRAAVMA